MSKNETIADIVANIRAAAFLQTADSPQSVRRLADRIEAAHKREVDKLNSVIQAPCSAFDAEQDRQRRAAPGNAAAMREALVKIREIVTADAPADEVEIANIAYLALAKPPRNCDVGTAEEQAERLNEWCNGRHCINCPFKGGWPDECKLRWAQMPYEEGGAK